MIHLSIPGVPIAKKRPRFARVGNFVKTYNPQESEEGRFVWDLRQQWTQAPLTQAISLEAIFHMPIPKGTSVKKRGQMCNGEVKHTKRPDCDNLLKFLKDCFNGVVWKDDSQVYKVIAEKRYSENPRTSVSLYWE